MNRRLLSFAAVAACGLVRLVTFPEPAEKPPVVVVRGPTVVAFYDPADPAARAADDGSNEALADFQFYAGSVREPFSKRGVEFHELYAHSIRFRIGGKDVIFRTGKTGVGYYLIAPGRKPLIEHGVMTDADLLQAASQYFAPPGK